MILEPEDSKLDTGGILPGELSVRHRSDATREPYVIASVSLTILV